MRADPHPEEIIIILDGQRTIAAADTRRPQVADTFEAERGMGRILGEQAKVPPGHELHRLRQPLEGRPEPRRRAMHL